MPKLLIVDAEDRMRSAMRDILEYESYEVDEAQNGEQGFDMIQNREYDVVLTDIAMGAMNGFELISKTNDLGLKTQFIVVSADKNAETIQKATALGAFDYLSKPVDLNKQLSSIKQAIIKSANCVKIETNITNSCSSIIGNSMAVGRMKEIIQKVGPTEARVLITGPNGSGKELVAQCLHQLSSRSKNMFIEVNCAAIPSELIESELFGHEKGSFTSAIKTRPGKFELANNGTLFLDEVGDMSLAAQAKVLRALQENKITRVGADKDITVNVRIIAATNKNLKEEIQAGRFREDLYHRLCVVPIKVPSLAQRKEDIPLLFGHFLQKTCKKMKISSKKIDTKALAYLCQHEWTGNIRELQNVVERLVILCDDVITLDDVQAYTDL